MGTGERRITGVIDFSFAALGDPAVDIASLHSLGDELLVRLAAYYQSDPYRRDVLLTRARFFAGTYALMEALDGLRDGDDKSYRSGMQPYI